MWPKYARICRINCLNIVLHHVVSTDKIFTCSGKNIYMLHTKINVSFDNPLKFWVLKTIWFKIEKTNKTDSSA